MPYGMAFETVIAACLFLYAADFLDDYDTTGFEKSSFSRIIGISQCANEDLILDS